MEIIYLKLSEEMSPGTIRYSGELSKDKKDAEIILQFDKDPKSLDPEMLKAFFMLLCEGILNPNPSDTIPRIKINYDIIKIDDYYCLATELRKTTGLKFSVADLN